MAKANQKSQKNLAWVRREMKKRKKTNPYIKPAFYESGINGL